MVGPDAFAPLQVTWKTRGPTLQGEVMGYSTACSQALDHLFSAHLSYPAPALLPTLLPLVSPHLATPILHGRRGPVACLNETHSGHKSPFIQTYTLTHTAGPGARTASIHPSMVLCGRHMARPQGLVLALPLINRTPVSKSLTTLPTGADHICPACPIVLL